MYPFDCFAAGTAPPALRASIQDSFTYSEQQ